MRTINSNNVITQKYKDGFDLVQYGTQTLQATKMLFCNQTKNQQLQWLDAAQNAVAYGPIFFPNQWLLLPELEHQGTLVKSELHPVLFFSLAIQESHSRNLCHLAKWIDWDPCLLGSPVNISINNFTHIITWPPPSGKKIVSSNITSNAGIFSFLPWTSLSIWDGSQETTVLVNYELIN